jgi:hypothetical protein
MGRKTVRISFSCEGVDYTEDFSVFFNGVVRMKNTAAVET